MECPTIRAHTQGPHRRFVPGLRTGDARRPGRDLSAVRRRTTRTLLRRFAFSRATLNSEVPVPAYGETPYDQIIGNPSGDVPAASMRRSARTRHCLPISCGDCSRTARTHRSSTGSSIRRSASNLIEDPVAIAIAGGGSPNPNRRCRRTSIRIARIVRIRFRGRGGVARDAGRT